MFTVRVIRSRNGKTFKFQLADDITVENFFTPGFFGAAPFGKVNFQVIEWNNSSTVLYLTTKKIQFLEEFTSCGLTIVSGSTYPMGPKKLAGSGVPSFIHQTARGKEEAGADICKYFL